MFLSIWKIQHKWLNEKIIYSEKNDIGKYMQTLENDNNN